MHMHPRKDNRHICCLVRSFNGDLLKPAKLRHNLKLLCFITDRLTSTNNFSHFPFFKNILFDIDPGTRGEKKEHGFILQVEEMKP